MHKLPLILAINLLAISSNALSSSLSNDRAEADNCTSGGSVERAQRCLVESGYPHSKAYQNENGDLSISVSPSNISGSFSEYVSSMDDLNSPLLIKALESHGKKLNVKMGAVDKTTGVFDVDLIATDDGHSASHGAIVVSNLGPDISGRDIVSWFNRYRIGDGYTLTSSLSHGFSDLRQESKDGQYETAFFSLGKVTSVGEFSADYTFAKNLSGGEARLYDLGGTTHRASVNSRHWFDNVVSFGQRLEYTERQQDFGSFDVNENQHYLSYSPELMADGDLGTISISLKKGVSGARDFDLVPLMGSFNPHYWSATLEANQDGYIGNSLVRQSTAFKGFTGSIDMPSSERIGLGGSGAGSSHESGLYSGHRGYHYSAGIAYSVHTKKSPFVVDVYANLNGGMITTALNDQIELSAVELGSQLSYKEWIVQASYSTSIKTQNLDDDQRISAKIIWRY